VVLGEEILLFGDGEQKRDFNYVDDAVEAFLTAAMTGESQGDFFNLGASPPASLREYVEILYEVAGEKPNYRLVPFPEERRRIDIGDFYTDYGKIQRKLGWEPRVDLREGVRRTIDFYRKNARHYVS
jgi:nucleoside-diphosphate-sugar epimerase